MSMNGEYLRVTKAELDRAIQDPRWAFDYAEEIRDTEDDAGLPPAEAKYYSTYKTWDLLGFLLRRLGFPVDVVHGEESFAEDEDWGYGPPKYLSADRVRQAADVLVGTSYDQLIGGVDRHELTQADVYSLGWDEAGSLEWARGWYVGLAQFFAAAARDGDAVLIWLD